MKKLLLLSCAALFIMTEAHAQCTPDTSVTHNIPGIYPDSVTNLPHAVVGTPYSTAMQLKVPLDTSTRVGPVTVPVQIDSIVLRQFTGFPAGFTYTCNPPSCKFPGGTNGCVLIQGPALPPNEAGNKYTLLAITNTYGHITGTSTALPMQADSINYYYIQVDAVSGILLPANAAFSVSQNRPNPFSKTSVIEIYTPSSAPVTFKVSNILGSVIYQKNFIAQQGNNKITLSAKDFQPGIYFYTVNTGTRTVTRRLIVEND